MKKYIVSFWYGTDRRWHEKVEAVNEVFALCAALNITAGMSSMSATWVTEAPFKITIEIDHPLPVLTSD